MNKPGLASVPFLLLVLLLAAPGQSYALDALEALKQCARTEDGTARAACYEDLGRAVLQADADGTRAAPDAAQSSTASNNAAGADVLPDTLGDETLAKPSEPEDQSYRGLVTSCQQAANKKWFYIFENGQVWKQADAAKRYYKDCNFSVTVTKDVFGNTMQIDGESGRVRISRHK